MILVLFAVAIAGSLWFFFLRQKMETLSASGTIEATEVRVSSKVMGRVEETRFEEGAGVSSAEVLLKIEDLEYAAVLESARAKYDIAKSDFERIKKLRAEKVVSLQDYERAEAAMKIASAAFLSAKIQYENTIVRSPISGTVLIKAIEKGELAGVGAPLYTLANLSSVNLKVYLAEKDVGKVDIGEEVLISVDSYPDEKFKGKVIYISDKAEFTPKAIQTKEERVTQVFGIKVSIPNPDLKLKPGMPADAEFQWNSQ